MTAQLMIYGLVVGVLLAAGAHFLDEASRAGRLPTRWIWALAISASALAPIVALRGPAPSAPTLSDGALPAEMLYQVFAAEKSPLPGGSGLSWKGDQALRYLWILSSSGVGLLILITVLRLRARAARWTRRRVLGVDVLLSEGLGPAVLGIVRPTIVLPAWVVDLEHEEIELILLHETEHRRSHDPALLAAGLLLVAVTPWNPVSWWLYRRLHLAVEADCDQRVLSRGFPPAAYGRLLLRMAHRSRPPPAFTPALVEGGRTTLERRLHMLRSHVRGRRILYGLSILVLGGFFLVLACETPTPQAPIEATEAAAEWAETEILGAPSEDGYFIVRRQGGEVRYLRSISPEEWGVPAPSPEEGKPADEAVVSEPPAYIVLKKPQGGHEADGPDVLQLSRFSQASPRPLIYMDGVRMRGSLWENPESLGLQADQIERVEVIKGAAAETLYGPEAAGGVIQIFTKR